MHPTKQGLSRIPVSSRYLHAVVEMKNVNKSWYFPHHCISLLVCYGSVLIAKAYLAVVERNLLIPNKSIWILMQRLPQLNRAVLQVAIMKTWQHNSWSLNSAGCHYVDMTAVAYWVPTVALSLNSAGCHYVNMTAMVYWVL